MAQKNEATSCTHDELGYYTCPINTTDTNALGILSLMISESGALPVFDSYLVVTANVFDTLCSTDKLETDITQITGTTQSAFDLQDLVDNGYDPVLKKIQGVVLTDTTTTNTDMVGTDNAALATALTTAQTDLNTITGADGVTLATLQGLYAPNKVIPDVAGTLATYDPPTKGEMDTAFTEIKGSTWASGTDSLEHIRDKQTEIEADTNELQTNQGNWATATGFATSGAMTTAQNDLNVITGVDGVTLATLQALYAPNKTVPDAAGTATTLHATTDGKIDVMDALIDAIKVKTDNLPSGITKNTALPKFDFLMVLASDHVSGATGKTVTGTISKDGGAFASITNTITEVSNGLYTIADGFTATEMNADVVTLRFTETDCDARILTIITS